MKLITKHSDYAIRAILVLAKEKNDFVSVRNIAKKQHIPYQFLRAILGKLIKHNLVISREGGKGGFKLNKKPELISIVDIIKIFQGNLQLSECMFRTQLCFNRKICPLREEIKRIEGIVGREFNGVTIAKLLKNRR